MGRRLVVSICALGAMGGLAYGAGQPAVKVTPKRGYTETRFTVSFVAPDASGHTKYVNRQYVVQADGPTHRTTGCKNAATVDVPPTRAHARVKVHIGPGLCKGAYTGKVEEFIRPVCNPDTPCPLFIAMRTIGSFAFQVQPDPTGVVHVPIAVSPHTGAPSSAITLTFTIPPHTARWAGTRTYALSVTGPAGSGCAASAATTAAGAQPGEHVTRRLAPAKPWCAGTFHGSFTEVQGPNCPNKSKPCPEFPTRLLATGTFSFKIVPGGDSTPPAFAGLKSAFQCFPGPMRPGETRPVTLSWDAASDDITSGSQITYDIYMSSVAGREDFSTPSWTTQGATSFTTPGLSAGRYFMVRARDNAGNEDGNRIERQASSPCV